MSHDLLHQVNDKYNNCTKCSFHKIRGDNPVAFGNGYADALGLLITGEPVFTDDQHPAPYGEDTEPGQSLKTIWELANIDPADWYHVPAFMCKSNGDYSHEFDAMFECSNRLKEVLYAVSPAIVVCAGGQALEAFLGPVAASPYLRRMGPIPVTNYIAVHTHCLKTYHNDLNAGRNVSDRSQVILKHWENIHIMVENIKRKC